MIKILLPLLILLWSIPLYAGNVVTMFKTGAPPAESFPHDVAVVENFSDALASPWTDYVGSTAATGGVGVPTLTDGLWVAGWNVSKGPSWSAYLTISTLPAEGKKVDLFGSYVDETASYFVRYTRKSGTDTIELYAGTTQKGTVDQEVSAGDSIGIDYVDGTLRSLYKSGAGSWVEKTSVSDTSLYEISTGSSISSDSDAVRIDNLGWGYSGGTCSTSNDGNYFDFTGATGSSPAYIYSGYTSATQFTSVGTDVTEYKIKITAVDVAGDLTLQLYTDSSDSVGSAISGTNVTQTVSTTGVKTLTLSSPYTSLTAGTKYWLVASATGSTTLQSQAVSRSGYRWKDGTTYNADYVMLVGVLGCAR